MRYWLPYVSGSIQSGTQAEEVRTPLVACVGDHLIPKKKDLDVVTIPKKKTWMWPITLSNIIGKLYASVLADSLGKWCRENNRISSAQKGFMPFEGCSKHNQTLQSSIQNARRRRKEIVVAWLYLKNAFGSIPHKTIFNAMRWAGLYSESIILIERFYSGCTTKIRTHQG
ncbi:uncharacterized protein LOC113383702 [Ctenocephalides felis]|uniref:uncharacterized protein LOC113383702 n=1 Tax=Ctenocephalides felis TaxID=7515 RepID=UPI000E6E3C60|nr:uncharacterized protein LOC113383702 [Ctenocephalides felis]